MEIDKYDWQIRMFMTWEVPKNQASVQCFRLLMAKINLISDDIAVTD